MRGTSLDACRYWSVSPVFCQKRDVTCRGDFGDEKTIGLSLRRLGVSGSSLSGHDPDDAFGVYLGRHDDGWVVGIKRLDYSGWSGCEVFKTLEDLQRRWELD